MSSDEVFPADPAGLERVIAERRDHLAGTVDELMVRAHPRRLAERGLAEVRERALAAVRTPAGDLRLERFGAVLAALAALMAASALIRRRRGRS